MHIYDNFWLNFSLNEKCFGETCTEYQNIFNVQKRFPENRAVYEIMWKNTVQPGRPRLTI